MAQVLPQAADHAGELPRLLVVRRHHQTSRARRLPRLAQHLAQERDLLLWRQGERGHRRAERLKEHRLTLAIVGQQAHIAMPLRALEHAQLVGKAHLRDRDLEDGVAALRRLRPGHIRAGPARERLTHRDRPRAFQMRDHVRKVGKPPLAPLPQVQTRCRTRSGIGNKRSFTLSMTVSYLTCLRLIY